MPDEMVAAGAVKEHRALVTENVQDFQPLEAVAHARQKPFPTLILTTGLIQLAVLSLVLGLVIEAVSGSRREFKRMRYLDLPPPNRHS